MVEEKQKSELESESESKAEWDWEWNVEEMNDPLSIESKYKAQQLGLATRRLRALRSIQLDMQKLEFPGIPCSLFKNHRGSLKTARLGPINSKDISPSAASTRSRQFSTQLATPSSSHLLSPSAHQLSSPFSNQLSSRNPAIANKAGSQSPRTEVKLGAVATARRFPEINRGQIKSQWKEPRFDYYHSSKQSFKKEKQLLNDKQYTSITERIKLRGNQCRHIYPEAKTPTLTQPSITQHELQGAPKLLSIPIRTVFNSTDLHSPHRAFESGSGPGYGYSYGYESPPRSTSQQERLGLAFGVKRKSQC